MTDKKPVSISKPSEIFKGVSFKKYYKDNKLFTFDEENSVFPTKHDRSFYGKTLTYSYECNICGHNAIRISADGIQSIKCHMCKTMWDPIEKEFILDPSVKKVDGKIVIEGKRLKEISKKQKDDIKKSLKAVEDDDFENPAEELSDGTIKSFEDILQENSDTPIVQVDSKRKPKRSKSTQKTETVEETVDDVLEVPKNSVSSTDDDDENEYLEELPDGLSALELLGLLPDHGDRKSIIHLKPGDIVYYAGKLFMMK